MPEETQTCNERVSQENGTDQYKRHYGNLTNRLETHTVPDRSNLIGNALLERKWNAKWNAAGMPKEHQNFCGAGTRSFENARIENAFY